MGISRTDKERLSDFLLLQLTRTKEIRERLTSLFSAGSQAIENFIERTNAPYPKPDLALANEFDHDMASYLHGELLLKVLPLMKSSCDALMGHIWFIGVNGSDVPFWTSDTPVIMHHDSPSPQFWEGMSAPGIEIYFPLSQKYILVIRERVAFKDDTTKDSICVPFTEQEVMDANANQVVHCRQYVYSPSKDFAVAHEVCNQHPEICQQSGEILDELLKTYGR